METLSKTDREIVELITADVDSDGLARSRFSEYFRQAHPGYDPFVATVTPDECRGVLVDAGLIDCSTTEARPTIVIGDPEPEIEQPEVVETRTPSREADYRAAVMNDSRLSQQAAWAAVCIVFRCWKSGELFAGAAEIARWMHMSGSSRKNVRKYLGELVRYGYLEEIGQHNRTTRYRLTLPVG